MGRSLQNRRKKIDEDHFFRDHHDFGRKIAKLEIKSKGGLQELKSRFFGSSQKVFADPCFRDHQIFALKLNSVYQSGLLSYLGLESGLQYEKD